MESLKLVAFRDSMFSSIFCGFKWVKIVSSRRKSTGVLTVASRLLLRDKFLQLCSELRRAVWDQVGCANSSDQA
jgi:hypothetical protein